LARQKTPPENTKTPPEARRAIEYVGLFTRVAQKVGVTPSHAVQVAKNKRTSKRVLEAIVTEVRRIERVSGRAA
jgi:hypothetical protein